MEIVKKLNSVKGLTRTFIKTSNGFKVVNPEGYVAIDRVSGMQLNLLIEWNLVSITLLQLKGMGQMKTLNELYTEVNSLDEKQTPAQAMQTAVKWQEE